MAALIVFIVILCLIVAVIVFLFFRWKSNFMAETEYLYNEAASGLTTIAEAAETKKAALKALAEYASPRIDFASMILDSLNDMPVWQGFADRGAAIDALSSLDACASRLRNLMAAHPDVKTETEWVRMTADFSDACTGLGFAINAYDASVDAYSAKMQFFPGSLVARIHHLPKLTKI
jgi:hypothetical protein